MALRGESSLGPDQDGLHDCTLMSVKVGIADRSRSSHSGRSATFPFAIKAAPERLAVAVRIYNPARCGCAIRTLRRESKAVNSIRSSAASAQRVGKPTSGRGLQLYAVALTPRPTRKRRPTDAFLPDDGKDLYDRSAAPRRRNERQCDLVAGAPPNVPGRLRDPVHSPRAALPMHTQHRSHSRN